MTDEAELSLEPELAASEPTLDDVISEFNIGNDVTPQVETPTESQFAPQTEIDPYDAASIQNFVSSQTNALSQKLEQYESKFSAIEAEKKEAQFQSDVKQAVGVLTSNIEGISDKHARFLLESKAEESEAFRAIWNNRNIKPQAFDKAMQILVNESKNAFTMTIDSNLVENQRAMQQSMQTNSNQPVSQNEWEQKLNEASSFEERDRIRSQMIHG